MKILVQIIDWEYPPEKESYGPMVWDLTNKDKLFDLVLALGNGIILEMHAEADSQEALFTLRGLIKGVGGCHSVVLDAEKRQQLWLYHDDYECYQQGTDGFIFINPVPQPQKFGIDV